jgi:hypothetical protein
MSNRKAEYLELVEKLEKMQKVLKPRMGEIADAVVKSCVIKDLREAKTRCCSIYLLGNQERAI